MIQPIVDGARSLLRQPSNLARFGLAGLVYAIAGLTVPAMLLFFGNTGLPWGIEKGLELPWYQAAAIDACLVALFGLQHSLMARVSFKTYIARWVPPGQERTVYVFATCVVVWMLMLGWAPIGTPFVEFSGVLGTALDVGFWVGFALVYVATLMLGHTELLGLKQAWDAYACDQVETEPIRLRTGGVYSLVRHPLMTGLVVCLWSTSELSVSRLVIAGGLTGYVVLGTHFEEKDLIGEFGEEYVAYTSRVASFIPFAKKRRATRPTTLPYG